MSYEELNEKFNGLNKNEKYFTTNEDSEIVGVEHCDDYIVVSTSQSNGWTRVKTYWKDGTIEEEYER